MTHTLGPLTVKGPSTEFSDDDGTIGGDYAIWDKDGKIIARVYRHVGYDDVRPAYANAGLFAAAPDLLEAAIDAEQLLSLLTVHVNDNYIDGVWVDGDALDHKIEQLRAAIASVTGGEDDEC